MKIRQNKQQFSFQFFLTSFFIVVLFDPKLDQNPLK